MHILFALPGLHRVERGAEVAFEAVAAEIARRGRHTVALAGSGKRRPGLPYEFHHVPCCDRHRFERWPTMPFLRSEFMYEDLTFAAALALRGSFGADLTVTCSYPYTSLALRRPTANMRRPAHVFVTQNGDWPARLQSSEARLFSCEGLVCTNPIYYERNIARWRCGLIPNGVDPAVFSPGKDERVSLGLPLDKRIVLMVSALEPGKRVLEAIAATAPVESAHLIIAGDGPLRDQVDQTAARLMPGRFQRITLPRERMPALYRSADLFLHTKIEESFGNVYIEALSSGLKVVAHDDQVTRWIFEGRAALVDTTDQAALTGAIRVALAQPSEAGGENAQFAHRRYAWTEIARAYEQFFETVLDLRDGPQL